MSKFFEIFGKVTLVLIILSLFIYGGYYLGTRNKIATKVTEKISEKVIEISPSPTPVNVAIVSLSAGVPKSSGLSFDEYSISVPETWTNRKESQTALDEKLILEKEGYTISIFQAATGGALCLFKGDADFEGPSSKFDYFVELTSKDGRILRRSGEKNGTSFTICQKAPDGSFQQPTNYGHISIKLPSAWDDEGLLEVDRIISSLKKI
jgi:hypothetical protein